MPIQVPAVEVGVMIYLTTTGAVVVFVKVSVIGDAEPVPAVLLIPVTAARVQA